MNREFLMIDLCSGLGGASQAMKDRGWNVLQVDIDPKFRPDIIADVRTWSYEGPQPDLIWASPPCEEFARESMPWSRIGKKPDLSIVEGCIRIIKESKPRYWVIENVRGAVPFFKPILGNPTKIFGPFFLWGDLPLLPDLKIKYQKKESFSSSKKEERAKIPYQLSLMIALNIEAHQKLWEESIKEDS